MGSTAGTGWSTRASGRGSTRREAAAIFGPICRRRALRRARRGLGGAGHRRSRLGEDGGDWEEHSSNRARIYAAVRQTRFRANPSPSSFDVASSAGTVEEFYIGSRLGSSAGSLEHSCIRWRIYAGRRRLDSNLDSRYSRDLPCSFVAFFVVFFCGFSVCELVFCCFGWCLCLYFVHC